MVHLKDKDRGKANSSAANEEQFDAQHTAVRLAMELPRHNWLVKHLIKEKKLKAEDEKPANGSPENAEETNSEETEKVKVEVSGAKVEGQEEPQRKQGLKVEIVEEMLVQSPKDIESEMDMYKGHANLKGPHMVGIVKPFQHLKVFPVHISNRGGKDPNMNPLVTMRELEKGSTNPPTEAQENGQGKNFKDNPENSYRDLITPPPLCIDDTPTSSTPLESNSNTQESKPELTSSVANSNDNHSASNMAAAPINIKSESCAMQPQIELVFTKNLSSQSPSVLEENKDKAPSTIITSENSSSVEPNSEPDITISNCFSLALDLSKKSSEEQPLDLSVCSKKQKSPDILDLTAKKPKFEVKKSGNTVLPSNCNPPDQVISDQKSVNPEGNTREPLSGETPNTSTSSKSKSNQPTSTNLPQPNDQTIATNSENSDVIIIDDDGAKTSGPVKKRETLGAKLKAMKDSFVKIKNVESSSQELKVWRQAGHDCSTDPKLRRHTSVPGLPNAEKSKTPENMARRHVSVDLSNEQKWQDITKVALKRQHGMISVSDPQNVQFMSSPQAKKKRVTAPQPPPNVQNSKLDQMNSIYHLINFPQSDPLPQARIHQPQERHMTPNSNIQRPNPNSLANPIPSPIIRTPGPALMATGPPNVGNGLPVRYFTNPRGAVVSERAPATISTFSTQQVRPHSGSVVVPVSINPAFRPGPTKLARPDQPNPVLTSRAAQTYTRIPLDVNNNNITTLVHRHPHPPQMQPTYVLNQGTPKPMHNPPVTSSGTRPPMQPNHPNPPIARPPLGLATKQFIQEQQKIVDEKIRQLEAIKRELTMREKSAHGHAPVPVSNQHKPVNTVYQPQGIRRPPPTYQPSTNQGPAMPMPRLNQPVRAQQQPINQIPQQPRMIPNQAPPHPALSQSHSVPVYRNGGLSITRRETPALKTSLAEPIIIDDDIVAKKHSLIARNRHSYSFHPPLSKNKGPPPGVKPFPSMQHRMRMPVPQQAMGNPLTVPQPPHHHPRMIQTVQAPPQSSSPAEICFVCGSKSFFLCSGCKKTWYCSKDCQFKDWTQHSAHCSG